MIESDYHPDLIPYEEMSRILHQKFKATHNEIRYWVKRSLKYIKSSQEMLVDDAGSLLFPFVSDLPYLDTYEYPPHDFFYPHCYFYDKKCVNKFIPSPPVRFVYQKDLTGHRNWNDHKTIGDHSLVSQTLLKANEYGILRFYDTSLDEFTLYAKAPQVWCYSFEGEAYVSNPDSFFLLYEILTLERVFFNKDKQACLDELEIKNCPLPANVYNFSKK